MYCRRSPGVENEFPPILVVRARWIFLKNWLGSQYLLCLLAIYRPYASKLAVANPEERLVCVTSDLLVGVDS